MIEELIKDPLKTLKKLSNDEIVNILKEADTRFFNEDEPLFSDDIYDIVKGYLKKKDPKNPYFKTVGADVLINKEKLPFYMGSLDKIKDNDKEIIKWKTKFQGNYVISEKLDGISALIYKNKDTIKLFTRGNGIEGQNITHILEYILPSLKDLPNKIAIRGELIISRANWKKISHLGSNARNVVAGTIHSKTINSEIIDKIEFIAYDVLNPKYKLSDAYKLLESLHIPTVKYIELTETELTLETLSTILQDWRKISLYEIDGIVVSHDDIHKLISGKNPKYAFAFKTMLTQEQAEVIVTDVEWNVSKHRYLKPLVKFNEITISGVKIKQATGFNANYIEKNSIGPGARIVIIRSGDVIPHIIAVISPAKNPKMPDVPYKWNDTKIDIILEDDTKNKEHDIQAYVYFMKTLEVEGVKEGVITKIYDAGYDTLQKIIHISLEELKTIDTFKEKSATNIYNALQKIKETDCIKLMTALNIFGRGFGEKKIKLILDIYPKIPYDKKEGLKLKIENLTKIKGMAEISAIQFIEGLPKYYEFIESIGFKCKNKELKDEEEDEIPKIEFFKDKKIVFTGFRNKNYENILEKNGAHITTSISTYTNLLIIKDHTEKSAKIEKAKKLGIQIITKEELEEMLSL